MNTSKLLLGFLIAFCLFNLAFISYIVATIGYVKGVGLAFAGIIGLICLSSFAFSLQKI